MSNRVNPTAAAREGVRQSSPLLEVRGLELTYAQGGLSLPFFRRQPKPVVHDISFAVEPQQTFALVGESGSGKTTIARAVAGLLKPSRGKILFEGSDISVGVEHRNQQMLQQIQFVFQNPDASLNPRLSVAYSLGRPLDFTVSQSPPKRREESVSDALGRRVEQTTRLTGAAKKRRVAELLDEVHLDQSYLRRFPTQLSGGERQRVAIARALAAEPRLILCDEVVSALDVSVQAAILDLLRELQEERGISYLFIAHNLAVVRWLAHRVGVLYLGHLLEVGTAEEVFSPPWHPYTEMLLQSVPEPDPTRPFPALGHAAPAADTGRGRGCPFASRCPRQLGPVCANEMPGWGQWGEGHMIRCNIPTEDLVLLQTPVV